MKNTDIKEEIKSVQSRLEAWRYELKTNRCGYERHAEKIIKELEQDLLDLTKKADDRLSMPL